ncbi:MAG: L,D-transpeptidase family protein [Pseudomonadota bacterium]
MTKKPNPPADRCPRRSNGVNRRQVLLAASGLAASLTPVSSALGGDERWYDAIFKDDADEVTRPARKSKVLRLDDSDLNTSSVPLVSKAMLKRFDKAIEDYERLVKKGGWPGLKRGRFLRSGSRHRTITLVRKQLIITGDFDNSGHVWAQDEDYFDEGLVAALKNYQHRHGLRVTGRLDRSTRSQLAYSAKDRLKQLKRNRERLAKLLKMATAERYVLVNVPGYQLEAVAKGDVERRHTVIVGRADRQTPDLTATIRGVNFFPFWRVPYSIAKRDLIPRARKDPGFIEKQHFRVSAGSFGGPRISPDDISWNRASAHKLKFRQDPGPWNALGLVRINMPNKDIIYLHDTPMKHLFKQRYRAFSAGCIRVHDVMALVSWLGQDEPGLKPDAIERLLDRTDAADLREKRSKSLNFRLARAVPVHLVYLTAWIEDDGQVVFRSDIYNRDDNRSSGRLQLAKAKAMRDLTP